MSKPLSPSPLLKRVLKNYELYLFVLPALLYLLVFNYAPMYGVQIAFKDFQPKLGIAGSHWVGLKHLLRFVRMPSFFQLIENTLSISLYTLLVGFPVPILLALALNELRSQRFKRVVQTVSYAPHFISVVVLISMLRVFTNADYGVLNKLLSVFGYAPVSFMAEEGYFRSLYVLSGVWQSAGWNAIIYLSALAGVPVEQHESAMIDGASRLQRIWYINLPGILPTVSIMFIMQVGGLMSVGFEKVFLMQNSTNLALSEVISTYVYKVGLLQVQYSFSTMVGLFNSVINCILLVLTNFVSKRLNGSGLF